MKDTSLPRLAHRLTGFLLTACVGFTFTPLQSAAFQFEEGEWRGSFDTNISIGGQYRLSDPDPKYYSRTSGGLQNSSNSDDGNLNYEKGWVSTLFKISHDFQLSRDNYGLFLRGYYFADGKSDSTKRTPLSDQAKDRVKSGAEFLDMYIYGQFELGDVPVDLRVGRQVLSLGESTFIPNGNNVVNPVDLSKLRTPGAELKEAFLPVNMIKASIGLTPNITIEPFWLLEFRRNEIEPAGSYFSTNDFASRGGDTVWLGFVGIGVDYGIYIFSKLQQSLKRGQPFEEALYSAYSQTGSAVVFTGFTLAIGVSTWLFSSLKFQADMGLLLVFMFLVNMLGAIILLPAMARWLYRDKA